ncbi:TCP-1/cpn60 chaperonin family protein [Halorubraceae archaeon YAN]|nr:TCP-1/cpn60 chaperonin family protein [Halorubraceae archaeon YAN]
MATTPKPTDSVDFEPVESEPIESGITLAEAIHTTLGPNGMDKMLVGSNGRVIVTNNGSSILERLDITQPIGKVLENMVQIQQQAVGDGTTTSLVLIGALLSNAQSLREDGLHPTTIIEGYHQAAIFAQGQLPNYILSLSSNGDKRLQSVAETAVTGRWDDQSTELFASRTVSALRAVDFEPHRLSIDAYSGGELSESHIIDGILVDLDTSSTTIEVLDSYGFQSFNRPRIALVGSELTVDTPNRVERASLTDPQQVNEFRKYEQTVRDTVVHQLRAVETDIVFCQKSVDKEIRSKLATEGILAVERTRQDEFDAIARSTGATVLQSVDELTQQAIGYAESVRQRQFGSANVLTISGQNKESHATLCMRGGTPHVSDEIERITQTCSTVIQHAHRDGSVIAGGGATAMALAQDLLAFADSVSGRQQLAIREFADALERVPRVLATNAGNNPIDTLAVLRNRHNDGNSSVGISRSGTPRDMSEAGVLEPRVVFEHSLRTAFEAASMVLRIDSVETAAESKSDHHHSDCHGGCDHHDHSGTAHHSSGGYPWALSH